MASAMPNLQLPSQLQGINALLLVPHYTAWWERHVYEQLAQGRYLMAEQPETEPVTSESP